METLTIIISASIIFLIYFARYKNNGIKTSLFSNTFLEKADEAIFTFIKFIFKMYVLLFHNVKTFCVTMSHGTIHIVHKVSNAIAQKTHSIIEKIRKNTHR